MHIVFLRLFLAIYYLIFIFRVAAAKKPVVPEYILKRRKAKAELKAKLAKQKAATAKDRLKKKKLWIERARKYEREYAHMEKHELDMQKIAKKNDNFYVPAEPKLAFVIRIRG